MNVAEWLVPEPGPRRFPDNAPRQLAALLADAGTRLVSDQPARMSAGDALNLWGLRLRNTKITGKSLYGAARLVANLRRVPVGTEVEQFGLMGDRMAGTVLFDGRDHQFLGAVVVKR
ncbi:hypothetical protein [Cupriavidus basilensis]|uniref:hypothetical protein n=1 Tax=Cupriavidus basilensis TaxID=68895 RepID=UPI002841B309|nr:hypothetical protein [Cupriavidus basilensis]MDR3381025.1 hypothetical protein [Cupriavidus basilensis]